VRSPREPSAPARLQRGLTAEPLGCSITLVVVQCHARIVSPSGDSATAQDYRNFRAHLTVLRMLYVISSREPALGDRSWTPARFALAHDSQHGVRGVVHAHPGIRKAADGADDRDHRVGCGETKSKADPVLQSPPLRVALTACPTPQSEREDGGSAFYGTSSAPRSLTIRGFP
jgi:hypothetical protein